MAHPLIHGFFHSIASLGYVPFALTSVFLSSSTPFLSLGPVGIILLAFIPPLTMFPTLCFTYRYLDRFEAISLSVQRARIYIMLAGSGLCCLVAAQLLMVHVVNNSHNSTYNHMTHIPPPLQSPLSHDDNISGQSIVSNNQLGVSIASSLSVTVIPPALFQDDGGADPWFEATIPVANSQLDGSSSLSNPTLQEAGVSDQQEQAHSIQTIEDGNVIAAVKVHRDEKSVSQLDSESTPSRASPSSHNRNFQRQSLSESKNPKNDNDHTATPNSSSSASSTPKESSIFVKDAESKNDNNREFSPGYNLAGVHMMVFIAAQTFLIFLLGTLFLGVLIMTEFVLDKEDDDLARTRSHFWGRVLGIGSATVVSAVHGSFLSGYVLLDGQSDWIAKAVVGTILFYWITMTWIMNRITDPLPY